MSDEFYVLINKENLNFYEDDIYIPFGYNIKVDLNEVPNIIHGQVKMKDKLQEYEWLDDGTCQKAIDNIGNPKKPAESDNLVKAI